MSVKKIGHGISKCGVFNCHSKMCGVGDNCNYHSKSSTAGGHIDEVSLALRKMESQGLSVDVINSRLKTNVVKKNADGSISICYDSLGGVDNLKGKMDLLKTKHQFTVAETRAVNKFVNEKSVEIERKYKNFEGVKESPAAIKKALKFLAMVVIISLGVKLLGSIVLMNLDIFGLPALVLYGIKSTVGSI